MTDKVEIFDELVALIDHPEKLAKKREEIIANFIMDLPENVQERARSIQWRLDKELDMCNNSTERFNKMVSIFWKQFSDFNHALHGIPNSNDKFGKVIDIQSAKK